MYGDECIISDPVLKNIRCHYPGNIKGTGMNGPLLQFLHFYLSAQSTGLIPSHRFEVAVDLCVIGYLIDFIDVRMESFRIVSAAQFVGVSCVGVTGKQHSVVPGESEDAVI